MPLHPKAPKDLSLAPVAANIDLNLQRIRDMSQEQIIYELELMLDRPVTGGSRVERTRRIQEYATRNVDLHDWTTEVTSDAARLRLSGGSVSLDLGLSAALQQFIVG